MDSRAVSSKLVEDESLELCMGNNCWQVILNAVVIGLVGSMGYWNIQYFGTTLIDLEPDIVVHSVSMIDVRCIVGGMWASLKIK